MIVRSPKLLSQAEYDSQFKEWQRSVWIREKEKRKTVKKETLARKIRAELAELRQLSSSDYELKRKWYELQEFKTKHTSERLDQVYDRIWKPSGYSDFRRIEPELIYVKETVTSRKVDIWGNFTEREWALTDPLAKDWDILRTLVSRHRNAGVIGKQHRYLVRDKGTKKYLGVICVSVDMLEPAGRDQIIGWKGDQKKRTQPHCANGSTIVAISPLTLMPRTTFIPKCPYNAL